MHRLVAVGLALLLGCSTNAVIAWSQAWAVDLRYATIDWLLASHSTDLDVLSGGSLGTLEHPDSHHGPWFVAVARPYRSLFIESHWSDPRRLGGMQGPFPRTPPAPLIPRWAGFLIPPPTPTRDFQHVRLAFATGWPFLSMWCRAGGDSNASAPLPTAWSPAITSAPTETGYPAHVLPLAPIWGGLLANVALYTLPWILVLGAPRVAIRFSRRHRGLCPVCAYPIGSSPICAECGAGGRLTTRWSRRAGYAGSAACGPLSPPSAAGGPV
jgi:hypothetical protein